MAQIEANGITIEYEVTGSGPELLLIMGLSGQLTDWPSELVQLLAEHFTVITYDNRDAGLSTRIAEPVARSAILKALLRPSAVQAPYQLSDMADDASALLRALSIDRAHVVGMSMGAMIAQLMAIDHPARIRSLCSIMSNTGNSRTGQPTAKVAARLARRVEPDRDQAVDTMMDLFALIGGPDWDPIEQRQRFSTSIARSYRPDGLLRQSLAIAVSPERTARLGQVSAPTLVIHGLSDSLIRPSGGIATAKAVPGSRLLMFPGMGHDLPATRHAEIVEAIVRNTERCAHHPVSG